MVIVVGVDTVVVGRCHGRGRNTSVVVSGCRRLNQRLRPTQAVAVVACSRGG